LDVVHGGPRGTDNQYNIVQFDSSAKTIQSPTSDYDEVQNTIANKYKASGYTAMGDGIKKGAQHLKNAPADLLKVMVVVSDGVNNRGANPVTMANNAKNDGITIFALGFAKGHMNKLDQIAGKGAGSQVKCDECSKDIGGQSLDELNEWIDDNLCWQVAVEEQPWQVCDAGAERTKDLPWTDCEWGGCHNYPREWILDGQQNGSSAKCVQLANEGRCDDKYDPTRSVCGCTCRHCCQDPTPSPTSAPTDSPTPSPSQTPTHSPTPSPTQAPTDSPTGAPTHIPTEEPTSPTQTPTLNPTGGPTHAPTAPTSAPTEFPTSSPTPTPTQSPTFEPTASPTQSPTLEPTTSPTQSPTLEPTESPTQHPTQWPTYEGCPVPDALIDVEYENSWFQIKRDLKLILENYCHVVNGSWTKYNFDEVWEQATKEERIKVIRESGKHNLFDLNGEGINKQPFEPSKLAICWPENFPRTPEDVAQSEACGVETEVKSWATRKNTFATLLMVLSAVFVALK